MRSIRELMEEHERLDQALRAKFLDSVEGLEPVAVPETSTVAAEETEGVDTEELEDIENVDIPAQDAIDEGAIPSGPETPDREVDSEIPPIEGAVTDGASDGNVETDPAIPDFTGDVELPETDIYDPEIASIPEQSADTESDIDLPADDAIEFDEPEVDAQTVDELPAADIPTSQASPLDEAAVPESTSAQNDELPPADSVVSEMPPTPDAPTGFRGVIDQPAVTQEDLELEEVNDPSVSQEERSERQMDMHMRASDNLAAELAQELGPAFEEMREVQAQIVQDYVTEQQLVTWMLRAR